MNLLPRLETRKSLLLVVALMLAIGGGVLVAWARYARQDQGQSLGASAPDSATVRQPTTAQDSGTTADAADPRYPNSVAPKVEPDKPPRSPIPEQGDVTRIVVTFLSGGIPVEVQGFVRVVWGEGPVEPDRSEVHLEQAQVDGRRFECTLPASAREASTEFFLTGYAARSVLLKALRYGPDGLRSEHGEFVVELSVELNKAEASDGPVGRVFVDGIAGCPTGLRVMQESVDKGLTTRTAVLVHPKTGVFHLLGSTQSLSGLWFTSDVTVAKWLDGSEMRERWRAAENRVDLEHGSRLIVSVRTPQGTAVPHFAVRSKYVVIVDRDFGPLHTPVIRKHSSNDRGEFEIAGVPETGTVELLAGWGNSKDRLATYAGPRPPRTTYEILVVASPDPYFSIWGRFAEGEIEAPRTDAIRHVRYWARGKAGEIRRSSMDKADPAVWRGTCLAGQSWTLELYLGDRSISQPLVVEAQAGESVGPLVFVPRQSRQVTLRWSGVPSGASLTCNRILTDSSGRRSSVPVLGISGPTSESGWVPLEVEDTTDRLVAVLTNGNSWTHRREQSIPTGVDEIELEYVPAEYAAEIDDRDRSWAQELGSIRLVSADQSGGVDIEAPLVDGRIRLPLCLPRGSSLYVVQVPRLSLSALGMIDCDGRSPARQTWNGTRVSIAEAIERYGAIFSVERIGDHSLAAIPPKWRRIDLNALAESLRDGTKPGDIQHPRGDLIVGLPAGIQSRSLAPGDER